jgi:hypothetical protein
MLTSSYFVNHHHSDEGPLLSGIVGKSPSPPGRRVGMRGTLVGSALISKRSLTLTLSQRERELKHKPNNTPVFTPHTTATTYN